MAALASKATVRVAIMELLSSGVVVGNYSIAGGGETISHAADNQRRQDPPCHFVPPALAVQASSRGCAPAPVGVGLAPSHAASLALSHGRWQPGAHAQRRLQGWSQGAGVKAPRFSYVRAESIAQALTLLARHGPQAAVLAGGQSLMPMLNMRLSHPALLIDINRIDALKGIALAGERVRIGALVRHAELEASPLIAQHLPLIAEAMPLVAHLPVRHRGTFGGSIALADPAGELPACILASAAHLVLESSSGRREVAAEDYFKGFYETARRPDELLIEALIPSRKPGSLSVFMEFARRHGDFAIAGIALQLTRSGDTVAAARVAYFGSEDKPTLGRAVAGAIVGGRLEETTIKAAQAAVAEDLAPLSNQQASAALRLHLQRVLTGRALELARQRSEAA
jgi:carbon-monoxide dehydrogenase medium subunit